MMHAIVIDDEIRAVRTLEILLTRYAEGVKVVATSTDSRQGADLIDSYRPDIVFLDIDMPGMNGFEVLEQLKHQNFFLVFTTAHQEYGLKALKANASDYLLKPVEIGALNEALARIRKKMQEKQQPPDVGSIVSELLNKNKLKVPLITKHSVEYVQPDQISYIEASSHNTVVTLADGTVCHVNLTLKDFENMLCTEGSEFMRIHHSFVINLQHIKSYFRENGGYAVMQDKKSIPLSKHKKEEFLKRINLNQE